MVSRSVPDQTKTRKPTRRIKLEIPDGRLAGALSPRLPSLTSLRLPSSDRPAITNRIAFNMPSHQGESLHLPLLEFAVRCACRCSEP